VKRYPNISARQLGTRVINSAFRNDGFQSKDDSSCGIVYFRDPRTLLICTGPPFEKSRDQEMCEIVGNFKGSKIVMGATTGDIIARELKVNIQDGQEFTDPDLPPISFIEGIDLFTEGILTLNKVEKILKKYNNNFQLGRGPADMVVKLILESDEINILIGTRINLAHQDPATTVDLEIRRTVVKRIALLLEEKFLKKTQVAFI
jgi:hypothetical protein